MQGARQKQRCPLNDEPRLAWTHHAAAASHKLFPGRQTGNPPVGADKADHCDEALVCKQLAHLANAADVLLPAEAAATPGCSGPIFAVCMQLQERWCRLMRLQRSLVIQARDVMCWRAQRAGDV